MSNVDLLKNFKGQIFTPANEFKGIYPIPSGYSDKMIRDLILQGYDLNCLNSKRTESEQRPYVFGCECTSGQ